MRAKKQVGYTILEVLIFIAVSSLMFVSAMRAISGRQKQVQFTQSIQEFDAKIKDLINDVTTSYYPTNENVSCEIIGSDISISVGANQKLGTNDKCIYVGKVINFQSSADNTAMRIYAMAGKRYSDNQLTPSMSISDAKPKAVTSPGNSNFVETAEEYVPLYGLKITRVMRFVSDADFTDYGSIAIISNFGGSSISEAQAVQIGGILGSDIENDLQSSLNVINQITDDPGGGTLPTGYFEKNTDEGVVICLESPEGKKASLTVGINSGSSTLLQVDDYNEGCDAV